MMLINEAPFSLPTLQAGQVTLPLEPNGPAGRLFVEADGQLRFERDQRTILQSATSPTFSLGHDTEVEASQVLGSAWHGKSLTVHYETTQPNLCLTLEVEPTETGFRLRWSSPSKLSAIGARWQLSPQ